MISTQKFALKILCSSALVTGVISPAMASGPGVPEQFRNNDEHGVDLVTGTYNLEITEGSIGPSEGGVTLKRYFGKAGHRDNWSGDLRKVDEGGQMYVDITFGSTSERFKQVGSDWVPEKGNGATLEENVGGADFVYTARDGQKVEYSDPKVLAGAASSDVIAAPDGLCNTTNSLECGIPTKVTTPKSIEYDLKWEAAKNCPTAEPDCTVTVRMKDVRSNSGYAAKITYETDDDGSANDELPSEDWSKRKEAKFIDLAEDFCDADALNCDSVTGRSKVTYNNPNSLVVEITDDKGGDWKITNDTGLGFIKVVKPAESTDAVSAVVNPSNGMVSSIIDDGAIENYTWSTSSNGNPQVTKANAVGTSATVETDAATPQPMMTTNGVGDSVKTDYDANGRVIKITYPEGNYVDITYDARGNITQTLRKAKPTSTDLDIITTANFDATCVYQAKCNKPNYTIDAKGNRTDYTYDNVHGEVTRIQSPAPTTGGTRPEINYSYASQYAQVKDAAGNMVNAATPQTLLTQVTRCATAATCPGSADETKITIAYNNPNLLPSSVTTAAGDGSISAATSYTYDEDDNLLTIDGPLPGSDDTVHFYYDSLNRQKGSIGADPDGGGAQRRAAVRYTYDAASRRTKIESGNATSPGALSVMNVLQTENITYDSNNNVIKRTISGTAGIAQVAQYSYDADNRVVCSALRMNPAEFNSLTSDACVLDTAGTGANDFGKDRITKNYYDSAGRVTKVQTALGTAETADEVRTAYTPNGKVTHVIDAEDNRSTYEYDGHDRGDKIRFPVATQGANSSSTSDYIKLTFNKNDNLTSRRLRDGTMINYSYDNLKRRTLKDLPGSEADVSYGYDLFGRATSVTQGQTLSFAFDALGRNTSQTSSFGTISYEYDEASRRTKIIYPPAPGAEALSINYDYDVTGKVTKIRENDSTIPAGVLAEYDYDQQARRSLVTLGNGVEQSFTYDSEQRLASLANDLGNTAYDQIVTFAYNPANQIDTLTKSNDAYAWNEHLNVDRLYTVNGLNQLTQAGTESLGYDARGNLTSSGNDVYGYSAENLMTSGPGGATLSYDPFGRLHHVTGGGNTSQFLYDGVDMIGEYDSAGNVKHRYVHGPGIDEPILWYDGENLNNKKYMLSDERGSITSISDAAGSATSINSYDQYGIPAATNMGRFQYTGQVWLPEVGLYYYKARIYSPTLGRFMQTDPIGYSDGMNIYNYVGSDPINNTDSTGLAKSENCTGTRIKGPCRGTSNVVSIGISNNGGGRNSGDRCRGGSPGEIVVCGGGGTGGIGGSISDFSPGNGIVVRARGQTLQEMLGFLEDIDFRLEDLANQIVVEGQKVVCGAVSNIGDGDAVRLGVDAAAGQGPAGRFGLGLSIDNGGNIRFDSSAGLGAGFAAYGSAGLSYRFNAPQESSISVSGNGGVGFGVVGGSFQATAVGVNEDGDITGPDLSGEVGVGVPVFPSIKAGAEATVTLNSNFVASLGSVGC